MKKQFDVNLLNRLSYGLLFFAWLVFGLAMIPHAGVSWDEPIQLTYGHHVWNYVHGVWSPTYFSSQTEAATALATFKDRYYGPLFEILLVCFQKLFNLENFKSIILMRHWATYVFFGLGLVFFHRLAAQLFKWMQAQALFSPRYGEIFASALTLVFMLTPRILGHGFMNSKDIPFMVVFMGCVLAFIRWYQQPTLSRAALVGFSVGCLVTIRIVGLMAPAVFVSALLVHALVFKFFPKPQLLKEASIFNSLPQPRILAFQFVIACIVFLSTVYVFWPTLWLEPLGILTAIKQMAHFPWQGTVFYLGRDVLATQLPWHYVWVWMGITIPALVILFALIGLFWGLYKYGRSYWFKLMVFWLLGPVFLVSGLGSVLYDDWRHLYFIYPAVVLLSGVGFYGSVQLFFHAGTQRGFFVRHWPVFFSSHLHVFFSGDHCRLQIFRRRFLSFGGLLIVGYFALISFEIFSRKHYTYVGFNRVATVMFSPIESYFEGDYWGLCYKELLEQIAANQSGEDALAGRSFEDRAVEKAANFQSRARVSTSTYPGVMNVYMLEPDQQRRIELVRQGFGDMHTTNFRWQERKLRSVYYQDLTSVGVDISLHAFGPKMVIGGAMDVAQLHR